MSSGHKKEQKQKLIDSELKLAPTDPRGYSPRNLNQIKHHSRQQSQFSNHEGIYQNEFNFVPTINI